ncbi:MAG: cyclic nucleotide-binding domain-containing protein [bacterium]
MDDLKEIIEDLKRVSIFKNFADKPEELEKLAKIMGTRKARIGDIIIREGEIGNTLYIMRKGSVSIMKKTLANEYYTVRKLENKGGEYIFFGELALLDNDKRSATVIADSDCEFLTIERDDFTRLGDENPALGLPITREISKILAMRLRQANQDIVTLFQALVEEVEGKAP